jgi:hypothetical protein
MAQSSSASTSRDAANVVADSAADEDCQVFKAISKMEVKFEKNKKFCFFSKKILPLKNFIM